jgi:outer membrane autotransporter protein
LAAASTDGFAFWGRGFGSWGQWDGDGNAATIKRDIGGFFAGGDGIVADNWRVGVLGGYSRSTFNVRDRYAAGSSDNYHVGLYGGTQWGDLAFRSGAAYTWHKVSTDRVVAFPGFVDSLNADYNARTAQAFGEFGYGIQAGGVAFEPFANLAYVSLATDGFGEKGGAAALTSAGSTTNATFTTLGARAATTFSLGATTATAKGTLGWRHAYGDVTPVSQMRFAGGDVFSVAGVPIARNVGVVEAGLDFALSPSAVLGVSYGGQFGSGLSDQSVKANFNVKF